VEIIGDDRGRRVFAKDVDVAAFALDVDAFGVCAGFHEDDPAWRGGVGAHRRGADRFLQRGELSGAIEGDDDVSASCGVSTS
jgi:hypothetical protein